MAYITLPLCERLRYYETMLCYGNPPVATRVSVTTAISALLRYDERFLPGGLSASGLVLNVDLFSDGTVTTLKD